jgi:hypothetical protein
MWVMALCCCQKAVIKSSEKIKKFHFNEKLRSRNVQGRLLHWEILNKTFASFHKNSSLSPLLLLMLLLLCYRGLSK